MKKLDLKPFTHFPAPSMLTYVCDLEPEITEYSNNTKKLQKNRKVAVICDCQKLTDPQKEPKYVFLSHILSNRVISCGCFKKSNMSKIHTKHGLFKHPLYRKWQEIKQRCTNPKRSDYTRYGGRGITLHKSYTDKKNGFLNFYKDNLNLFEEHRRKLLEQFGDALQYITDENARLRFFQQQTTIDRINNNKGYEPGNIRFATLKEQSLNKRNTIMIEYIPKKDFTNAELISKPTRELITKEPLKVFSEKYKIPYQRLVYLVRQRFYTGDMLYKRFVLKQPLTQTDMLNKSEDQILNF